LELKNLVEQVDLALGDSMYNEAEMKELGFDLTGVLPLVMDFEKFDQHPLPVLSELFDDGKTNILYVGRIIPNKKVEDVIKVFHLYQKHHNPESRLFIVGEYRGFERYLYSLQQLIGKLGVREVHMSGHIPEDELASYYKLSHLYIHLSEHEGFCAPLAESFYLGIPVVAFAGGAVEETLNGGGILIRQKDLPGIAALMDRVLSDEKLRRDVLASQKKALAKYHQARTGPILLEHLKKIS
jgi:glycosyltransferase involved in cell wall biosynthesis